jgi:hypothetical protein
VTSRLRQGRKGQVVVVPTMAPRRHVLAFVGKERRSIHAGNLKAAPAGPLAERLATGEKVPAQLRSMGDLPETGHIFRSEAAAEFLAWRGTKIVAGMVTANAARMNGAVLTRTWPTT